LFARLAKIQFIAKGIVVVSCLGKGRIPAITLQGKKQLG
jgi:hypothetical protein